jgi:hypothetical protein
MRGCPESVQTQVFDIFTAHRVCTVPDQAGTQQWRSLHRRHVFRQGETVSMIRDGIFVESPVHPVAGVAGLFTKLFLSPFTIITMAAAPAQPRDADDSARFEVPGCPAGLDDFTNDLMTRYQWKSGFAEVTINDVQIRPADPASKNTDPDLPTVGPGFRDILHIQSLEMFIQNHRPHVGLTPSHPGRGRGKSLPDRIHQFNFPVNLKSRDNEPIAISNSPGSVVQASSPGS